MRPTGALHLGHLRGALGNWRRMQDEGVECFFFVADWHALTTDYARPADYAANAREMVAGWLAVGIDGERSTLFVQSQVPAHAELHVLLSMICPLAKLMQLPTYKEMRENLSRDLDTYGFLGYPLLQCADILAYRPDFVPVGEDQLPHIEFTREVARRFNRFYGGGEAFVREMRAVVRGLEAKTRAVIERCYRRFRQEGDEAALEEALAAVAALGGETAGDEALRARLRGYCRYDAAEILPLPEGAVTAAARLPGTDGRKMSKSYDNAIGLFDEAEVVARKTARMRTDPARMRRSDVGNPDDCPVFGLHSHFSEEGVRAWVREGCESAGIGCLECKAKLAEGIEAVLQPLRFARREVERTGAVEAALAAGNARAREVAGETLGRVRRAMRLAA